MPVTIEAVNEQNLFNDKDEWLLLRITIPKISICYLMFTSLECGLVLFPRLTDEQQ